jgi:hypothetical protein
LDELKKQTIILLLTLILAITTGFIPSWTGIETSVNDQISLSLQTFIALALIDILYIVANRLNNFRKTNEIWSLQNDGEHELNNIRASFHGILNNTYGNKDIFVAHYMKEFRRLSTEIRTVADRQELRVVANHFLNVDNVLDAFVGSEEKIWRFTWPISSENQLFEELPWKRYFEAVINKLHDKKINEIRAILILDQNADAESPRVSKLVNFIKTNKGMDCRYVYLKDYQKVCNDYNVPSIYTDFGVYANKLLYLAEQSVPESTGRFTKDIKVINEYINLFDTMWCSVSITKNPISSSTKTISLEELFDSDEKL